MVLQLLAVYNNLSVRFALVGPTNIACYRAEVSQFLAILAICVHQPGVSSGLLNCPRRKHSHISIIHFILQYSSDNTRRVVLIVSYNHLFLLRGEVLSSDRVVA